MTPTVTLRKAGWTAVFPHPKTGKRRQVVVESEEAGWILIKREQLQAAAEREQAIRSGTRVAPKEHQGGFTLAQAFELSWQRRFSQQSQSQRRCAKRVFGYASEFFGPNTQLDRITAQWLDEWRTYMNRTVKNKTVNRYVAVLQGMRSDAIEYGRLSSLPMWPKRLSETHETLPPRYLSEEEFQRMTAYWRQQAELRQKPNKWGEMEDFFKFRLVHGSRFEESKRLKVKDINWQAGSLTFWDTKNGEPHTFPMTSGDAEILRRRCKGLKPDETVFTMSYTTFFEKMKETREVLKLEGRVVGHVARHTMATRAIAEGESTANVMMWGNWKSLRSMRQYVHNDTKGMERTRDLMQHLFG